MLWFKRRFARKIDILELPATLGITCHGQGIVTSRY